MGLLKTALGKSISEEYRKSPGVEEPAWPYALLHKDSPGITTHQRSISLCNLRVPQTLTKDPASRRVMEAQRCALRWHRGPATACLLERKVKFSSMEAWKPQQNRCSTQRRDRRQGEISPQNAVWCSWFKKRDQRNRDWALKIHATLLSWALFPPLSMSVDGIRECLPPATLGESFHQ